MSLRQATREILGLGRGVFSRSIGSSSSVLKSAEGVAADGAASAASSAAKRSAGASTSAAEGASSAPASEPVSPFLRAVTFARDTMAYGMLAAVVWGTVYSYQYTLPEVETQVNDLRLKSQLNSGDPLVSLKLPVMSYYLNFRRSVEDKFNYYAAPIQPKLLPDVEQIYGPYIGSQIRTLAVDLVGVLVASEWSRDKGWRYYKRPGVEDFLKQANELGFEVVVYSPVSQSLADPILDKIDPQRQLITARLYRDHTQYVSEGLFGGGYHVCDLSKLNRSLARTLFVGCDPGTWKSQPENAIKLRKWEGQPGDTTLLDLIPFLEMIRKTNAPDTRAIVRSYEGKDFIDEFRERVRSLSEQKRQQAAATGTKPSVARFKTAL